MTKDDRETLRQLRRALRAAQIQLLVPDSLWRVDHWQWTLNEVGAALDATKPTRKAGGR